MLDREGDRSLKGIALTDWTSVSCKHKAQSCSITERLLLFFSPKKERPYLAICNIAILEIITVHRFAKKNKPAQHMSIAVPVV